MNHERFQNKANRDARAKELKTQGFRVTRRSSGPCELHPMYIKDLGYELSAEDKGFGNMIYKTYFSNTYVVEYQEAAQ